MIPYSVQESIHGGGVAVLTEQNPQQINLPLPPCGSSELKPKEDTSSSEVDWAEVQVEELNLENVKSKDVKHKSFFRRFVLYACHDSTPETTTTTTTTKNTLFLQLTD